MRIDPVVRRVVYACTLLVAAALPGAALGAGGDVPLMRAGNDIHNLPSLQRGARNFMNYCAGCHTAQYMRYNRIAQDLDIPEGELKANLMLKGGSVHDTIRNAMKPEDGRKWFGNAPPDLSLIARSRGPDYLYTFLMSYYADPSRPHGVDNRVLPGTAMPHVLAHLQGVQNAVYRTESSPDGSAIKEFERFEAGVPGSLTPAQYEEFVRDTVNFLEYVGEPVQAKRQKLGIWVILFLLVFTTFAYFLKREYWRDVK